MRTLPATATATGLAFAWLALATPSHADPPTVSLRTPEAPDGALALFAGSATAVAGFAAGGVLLGTSGDRNEPDNAGWLAIQGGFTLAPLVAHAVVGEWGRGALFSAVPAAMFGGSMGLIAYAPDVVSGGTLEQQRVLWAFFGVAFVSSVVGVVDAVLAGGRSKPAAGTTGPRSLGLAPVATAGGAGLALGGLL
jgi:hypothetical protein